MSKDGGEDKGFLETTGGDKKREVPSLWQPKSSNRYRLMEPRIWGNWTAYCRHNNPQNLQFELFLYQLLYPILQRAANSCKVKGRRK